MGLDILQKKKFLKNLTKSYTEGIYADTPANRKLGRVGMSYSNYRINKEDKKEKDFFTLNDLKKETEGKEIWYEGNIKGKRVRILQEEVGDSKWWNLEIDSNFIKNADDRVMSFESPEKAMEEFNEQKKEEKKIPLSSISVNGEDRYKYINGKSPKGYGNWAFKIGSDDIDKNPSKIFLVNGKYEEAKNKAKKEAQKRGNIYSVTLLS